MKDWVAVVTGCGQHDGIGAAIARELGALGAAVLVTDIAPPEGTADDLHGLCEEIRAGPAQAATHRTDVTDEAACERTIAFAIETFGRIDVLVNNAGAPHGADRQPYAKVPLAAWQKVIDVNLTGAFLMTRACAPYMSAQRRGRIINIGSIAALRGLTSRAAYSASKAGLLGLTASLAAELASDQITVNAICPGSIKTRRARSTAARTSGDVRQGLASVASIVPMGRMGSPEDVAHAVAFFASPGASYITGQVLAVAGGLEGFLDLDRTRAPTLVLGAQPVPAGR